MTYVKLQIENKKQYNFSDNKEKYDAIKVNGRNWQYLTLRYHYIVTSSSRCFTQLIIH